MKTPLLGICTGLPNKAIVEAAGANYLEVGVQDFLNPREDDALFAPKREAASKLGFPILSANVFLPANLKCVGPDADAGALAAYADVAFARAAELGIKYVVFGSSGARNVPEGFPMEQAREQFIRLLQKFGPLAERSGVTLVIEPLRSAECNFINTLQDGAEMVAACGHASVALLGDTFHMDSSGEGVDAVRQHGRQLRHFHVADYPARGYPGGSGQNYVAYFEALREAGYEGAISIECKWENLADEAGPALANLRRDLAAAGWTAAA